MFAFYSLGRIQFCTNCKFVINCTNHDTYSFSGDHFVSAARLLLKSSPLSPPSDGKMSSVSSSPTLFFDKYQGTEETEATATCLPIQEQSTMKVYCAWHLELFLNSDILGRTKKKISGRLHCLQKREKSEYIHCAWLAHKVPLIWLLICMRERSTKEHFKMQIAGKSSQRQSPVHLVWTEASDFDQKCEERTCLQPQETRSPFL